MNELFSHLYRPYSAEARAFGSAWCGPDKYEYSKEVLVARYEAEGDGQPAEVWCCAMPARFYHVKALAGKNSAGEFIPPFTLGTGSSMEHLAASMAEAIAAGMLSLHHPNTC